MSSESIVAKVQKHLEQLKTRNAKLVQENAKLKAALVEAKSSHSRIRRIPKKTAEPAPEQAEQAEPVAA